MALAIMNGALPSTPPTPEDVVRFADFELHERSGELRRAGVPIPLQDQPLHLLLALLAARGAVVTRAELRDLLWPCEIHVDFEHGLNAAVRRLREVLGDIAETPRFIETLPRHGYRFIAAIEGTVSQPSQRRRAAVLPFVNLTGDPAITCFCDGLTEDITTALSRLPSLRVVSRTSSMCFAGHNRDLREIARRLRADLVIEGSVRSTGAHVRVAARLIDARADAQIWAHNYDRDLGDIIRIENDVAAHVARAVGAALAAHGAHHPRDPS